MRPPAEAIIERPSALPVMGLNFDNKKELNKQLAKLDQDLRNAIAQKDGGAIQRFTQIQQAANDVLKAMKAGYSASEAQDFAAREAEIRQAQQRYPNPAPQAARNALPAAGTKIPGKPGDGSMAALQQRAAAGDPQASQILSVLGKDTPSTAQGNKVPTAPNSAPQIQNTIIDPKKNQLQQGFSEKHQKALADEKAKQKAAELDAMNRAKEAADQEARRRAEARELAKRNAVAQSLGYKDAQDFINKGGRFDLPKGGGGGGGGGGKGRGPTAKERNDAAKAKADKRADAEAKKIAQGWNPDTRKWEYEGGRLTPKTEPRIKPISNEPKNTKPLDKQWEDYWNKRAEQDKKNREGQKAASPLGEEPAIDFADPTKVNIPTVTSGYKDPNLASSGVTFRKINGRTVPIRVP